MTYTTEIIIELPLDDFIKKLNNAENMKHWQKGLVRYEYISGIPGELGSKMELFYKLGKREMNLTETIIYSKLPHELHMTYDTKGVHNIQKNYFESTPEGFTKWTSKNEFLPTTFTLRMMILLMPRAFKKQSMKYLLDFKNFAENDISVNEA
ncbi:SRPBCC family protein [Lacinutrix iliipiscaria]|uniref:SRPBCC family protein n=1 Tax=Lacinutrix iliipiscaria TaxID=1230532 RepID=A0ABW5WPH6_9FLAO